MTMRLPEPARSAFPPPTGPPESPESRGRVIERPSRSRRLTLIGLSAGLLGGATVGLAATLPNVGEAAGDPLPQLVAVPDEGGTSGSDGAGDTDVTIREPGEHLRGVLEPLVDDGTLTADQLDAVIAALVEARPPAHFDRHGPFGHRPGHGGAHFALDREELAAVLGVDVDTLSDELRSGTSLASIADAQGVDVEVVIDLLIADQLARLDDRVADGRLTEEQAADRAARLRERVTDLVNRAPRLMLEPPTAPDAPRPPDVAPGL